MSDDLRASKQNMKKGEPLHVPPTAIFVPHYRKKSYIQTYRKSNSRVNRLVDPLITP